MSVPKIICASDTQITLPELIGMTEMRQWNGTKPRCDGPFRKATSETKKPQKIELRVYVPRRF